MKFDVEKLNERWHCIFKISKMKKEGMHYIGVNSENGDVITMVFLFTGLLCCFYKNTNIDTIKEGQASIFYDKDVTNDDVSHCINEAIKDFKNITKRLNND